MSNLRALVAEDLAHVLFSLEMLLGQSGVDIVGAAANVAAMSRLAETVAADIAIVDVNLNGELVFPAIDLLVERGVPVIFTTGYAPDKIFPMRFLGLPILQKPYDPDELVRLIESVVAHARAV